MGRNDIRRAGNKEKTNGRQQGLQKVFANAVVGKVGQRTHAVVFIGNDAAQSVHDDLEDDSIENKPSEDAAACRQTGEERILRLCAVQRAANQNEDDQHRGDGQVALI